MRTAMHPLCRYVCFHIPPRLVHADPRPGIYLTDLIFIEEGIPSLIKNSDLINFYKRTKTAEVIREIMNYQNINYPFKTIPEIQSYIADKKEQAGNIHEMYNRSLKIEPREREDEKIARYAACPHQTSPTPR